MCVTIPYIEGLRSEMSHSMHFWNSQSHPRIFGDTWGLSRQTQAVLPPSVPEPQL